MPRKLKVRLPELLPYLWSTLPSSRPPFLPVKAVGPTPGVWTFPLGPYRVLHKVDGQTVWIGKIWRRPMGHDKTHPRQLARSFPL